MADRGTLVVTGASKGIGAAVARAAAADGWAVAVNYAGDADGAAAVVADIEAAGGRAAALPGDVSVEADVLRLFDAAEAALGGPVAGLVNNAGVVGAHGRFDELDAATVQRTVDVNVVGAMLCAREAVRRMSTRHGGKGGLIVNISSRAAQLGSAGEWVHYAATKAAVDTLTLGLAHEVAAEGVRVNAVAPGLIETGLHAGAGRPNRLAEKASSIPMGRAGTAEEVADAVMWLLSDASAFVTGAVVPVHGGR
ncbi:SDR family oxidoreductase [Yinghuangia soli]|uniref:SDR family oxidoreductase n=1 Tax=Yinghuangia soli TaxID=2908204 RepID=A0AA41Q725_9ACTN|nr:SDR family oxidoreductase [Yinghuangia soli]MCF2531564.1 SDR family oxidoreductase [Yinghuangia soli]